MGLAEELYFALIDVGYTARRCKIPGPLSQSMIRTARDWLEVWREDELAVNSFTSMLSSGVQHMVRMKINYRSPSSTRVGD